jgi:ERF superfamily
MNQLTTTQAAGYRDLIIRAASDPNFNVETLERIVALEEQREQRVGETAFNDAMSSAQAEMAPIAADCVNPQTRSKYASYTALDRAIRPIYTKHGFAVTFSTEPTGMPNEILVVGYVSKGGIKERKQVPMPIDTTGIQGKAVMTRTHATLAAISYGKRSCLTSMFNLTTDDDERASGRAPPQPPPPRQQQRAPQVADTEDVDPETGEVIPYNPGPPAGIEFDGNWPHWTNKLLKCVRAVDSRDLVQQWIDLNTSRINEMQSLRPNMHASLRKYLDDELRRVTPQQ